MRRNQKVLIEEYILEILREHASREKPLTQRQIIDILKERPYEISVSRNTLSQYISALRDAGMVLGKRGIYRKNYFDDHELRLLIDGVLFGQHIPKEVAVELIDKLKALSPQGLKNRIRHVYYLEGLNRTENKNLYEMIDKIDEAIQLQRKIRVVRSRYNEQKKRIRLENEYILDPYYLVTEKSQYYLICQMEKNGKPVDGLINLRVDRFLKVEILKNRKSRDIRDIKNYQNGFQLDEYMREHLYMVSGQTIPVKMSIMKEHIEDFIDWYGRNFKILSSTEKDVVIRFYVNDNALKYWALQYNAIATVLEPASLVTMLCEETERLMSKYLQNSN